MVYQLRCSFLHSGDTDFGKNSIQEEQNKLTVFNLELWKHDDILAASSGTDLHYGEDGNVDYRGLNVSVTFLCKIISSVSLNYYKSNKTRFNFFSYNIVDYTNQKSDCEDDS